MFHHISNIEKRDDNTMRNGVILMNIEVFRFEEKEEERMWNMGVSISSHIQTSQGLGSSLFMAYELLMRLRNVKSIILTAF